MTVNLKNEQNLEILLENLIRVQAKLIEKVDSLNMRLIQIEQTHQDSTPRYFHL